MAVLAVNLEVVTVGPKGLLSGWQDTRFTAAGSRAEEPVGVGVWDRQTLSRWGRPAGWSSAPAHGGSASGPPNMAVEGPWAQTWLPRHRGTQQASLWACGVVGRGLEASGSACLAAPGRCGGQCGPETIRSHAVLHVQELGVAHCCHSSAGTPRGQSPAGAFLRWPACSTPHHVLQVWPRCCRFPCVLGVYYGCDSPIVSTDPLSICGQSACLCQVTHFLSHPLCPAAHPSRPAAAPSDHGGLELSTCPQPSTTRVLRMCSAAAPVPFPYAFVVWMFSPGLYYYFF